MDMFHTHTLKNMMATLDNNQPLFVVKNKTACVTASEEQCKGEVMKFTSQIPQQYKLVNNMFVQQIFFSSCCCLFFSGPSDLWCSPRLRPWLLVGHDLHVGHFIHKHKAHCQWYVTDTQIYSILKQWRRQPTSLDVLFFRNQVVDNSKHPPAT